MLCISSSLLLFFLYIGIEFKHILTFHVKNDNLFSKYRQKINLNMSKLKPNNKLNESNSLKPPSDEQQKIIDTILSGDYNVQVDAVAGSGINML